MDYACPKCKKVYQDEEKCPDCGVSLTRDWSGKAAVITPEKSRVAKEMGVEMKGIYALKT